jgi:phytoene dehydrogenase-like protein
MSQIYDVIVIGAGAGGLSSALLALDKNKRVLILESHQTPGGCAGYFKRGSFTFDVGATTLGYAQANGVIDDFFKKINYHHEIIKIDPGIVFHLENKTVKRWSSEAKWLQELNLHFPFYPHYKFWIQTKKISDLLFACLPFFKQLPPKKISDLPPFKILVKLTPLLPLFFISLQSWIRLYQRIPNDLLKILNHLCLISAQNKTQDTPAIIGALALHYPAHTYYPMGGMGGLMKSLSELFLQRGGEILFGKKVLSVTQNEEHFLVKSENEIYFSNEVISNQTITSLDQKISYPSWGAFCVYFAVKFSSPESSLYHQIIDDSGFGMFVSLSYPGDLMKAPEEWQTVTISTHVNADEWQKTNPDYKENKQVLRDKMIELFRKHFNHLEIQEIKFLQAGTPSSFEYYTLRPQGKVGGIVHSLSLPFWRWPGQDKRKGFYRVGDTLFPGQGLVAVILGSMNVAKKRLLKNG